jgi:hypothetical protein
VKHSPSPVLRVGHWLLPWAVVVFASASIAYAVDGALAGDAWDHDLPPGTQVSVSSESSLSVTGQGCPPTDGDFGSYVDSFAVAEVRRIACGHGPP